MNSVTLYNFESGVIIDSYSSDMGQNTSDSNLINHRAKKPIWYGSLDGEGIYLKDTKVIIPERRNHEPIGYVSTVTSNAQGLWEQFPSVNIIFESPVNLTRGIVVWQHSTRDYTGTLRCTFYDEKNKVVSEADGINQIEDSASVMHIDIVGEKVKRVSIKPAPDSVTSVPFSFLKIDGVDLGEIQSIEGIIGEIETYAEIEPSKTDAPSGSCDITVQTKILPLVGQSFILNCDNGYKSKYTITNVSRTFEDIFVIQACDDIENLGAYIMNPYSGTSTTTNRNEFTDFTSVGWSDDNPLEEGAFFGRLLSGAISRQELAKLCAAVDMWVTAMGDEVGIHFVKQNTTPKRIASDKILGRAEYQNVMPYKGVIINNEFDGNKYVIRLNAPQAMNNNKGWLKVDNFLMFPDHITTEESEGYKKTAQNIVKYMNGNEVTATIIYDNEQLGDMVTIETPYNGNVTGFIKSIGLTIGIKSTLAEIVVKEVTD